SGHDGIARRRAHGRAAVGVREPHPALCQAIDAGRLPSCGRIVGRHIPATHVVGENENYVGPPRVRGASGGGKRDRRRKQRKHDGEIKLHVEKTASAGSARRVIRATLCFPWYLVGSARVGACRRAVVRTNVKSSAI